MKPNLFTFDIETAPLDDDALRAMEPEFSAPANYKDPDKIAAYIAEARAAWKEKAALSPLTGRVIMFAYLRSGYSPAVEIIGGDGKDWSESAECALLHMAWARLEKAAGEGALLGGWNTHRFDVPFLLRRSWALGVTAPRVAMMRRLGFPWVDGMLEFTRHAPGEYVSLETASRYFGTGRKNGDGAMVGKLLRENPEQAVAYALNDVVLTEANLLKMRVHEMGAPPPAVESVPEPTGY